MLTGRGVATGSNRVLDFELGQPCLLPMLANHVSFEKAIAFVRLTSVYLCSSTGLDKPGQGKNSLEDQVITIPSCSLPLSKGYVTHSWAGGAFAMKTPTLCALKNGGVTLVEMNLVEISQRYGKAVVCLAYPLPRGLEKSQGKKDTVSVLFPPSTTSSSRIPAAENPAEKQDRPLNKEAQ